MATYPELRERFASDALRSRLEVAVCIKAHAILQEPSPSTERKAWAASAFAATVGEADRMLRYLLAANKDQDTTTIDQVTDETIQTQTDQAVDKLFP